MKSGLKIFCIILFIAALTIVVIIWISKFKQTDCSSHIYNKLQNNGVSHRELIKFADEARVISTKQNDKFVRINKDSPISNITLIYNTFDPAYSYGIAAIEFQENEWIIIISRFANKIWDKDARLVLRPTLTSRKAFGEYITYFWGVKYYSDDIVGVCFASKQ